MLQRHQSPPGFCSWVANVKRQPRTHTLSSTPHPYPPPSPRVYGHTTTAVHDMSAPPPSLFLPQPFGHDVHLAGPRTQVAAAIQRGEEPPGIRVVEDRLSADATSLAAVSEPSPPKPWETAPLAGATAMPLSARAGTGAGAGAEAGTGAMPPSTRAGAGAGAGGGGGAGASGGSSHGYGGGEEGRSLPQHAVSVGP